MVSQQAHVAEIDIGSAKVASAEDTAPMADKATTDSAAPEDRAESGNGTVSGVDPASRILTIDIGGNNIKACLEGQEEIRKAKSGPSLTPQKLLEKLPKLTRDWSYNRITIGIPSPIKNNRVALEPHNLGKGWVDFNFEEALEAPTLVINDAAMQGLGSYEGGCMLFLGLGTGLGAALVVEETILPLEVAHLPYKKSRSFEDYVGQRGLTRLGVKRWKKAVFDVTSRLKAAMCADYVVLGGGNAKKLSDLPPDSRLGDNDNAFIGGFRLWQRHAATLPPS